MAAMASPAVDGEKKRKRPRAARACELCRAKKYRCDELMPCSQCKRQKIECVYDVADHVRQRRVQSDRFNQGLDDSDMQTSSAERANFPIQAAGKPDARNPTLTGEHRTSTAQTVPLGVTSSTGRSTAWRPVSAEQPPDENQDVEVSELNPHTQNPEFHGKTSSLAFLTALQTQTPGSVEGSGVVRPSATQQPSLVSMFHNEAFSPESLTQTHQENVLLESERYHFRQAQIFLDGYFQNIHFIHPILDKQLFRDRCEDLWFGRAHRQSRSFVALYYSVMSFGALIRTWDEDKLDGLGRLEWSRKLFNLARIAFDPLKSTMTIEAIQCLFFMAKVSQNELNPSLAYMYLGWATRASFSAGYNRRRSSTADPTSPSDDSISKLWWGLYSLEIEISFALGRPDSLGSDAYHNQVMPLLDDSETAIITAMVQFARIIRQVSISIYLSDENVEEKARTALEIEAAMTSWLSNLPSIIRPDLVEGQMIGRISKDPVWSKRQKLVLKLRFYNVKMVLFRPFLTAMLKGHRILSTQVREAVDKCIDAAKSTVEVMHDMYCNHIFFRSWFYNTTYILYAASIVLCYATKVDSPSERQKFLELGGKAVEILDAMEESVVAKNASKVVKQILAAASMLPEAEPQQSVSHNQTSQENYLSNSNALDENIFTTDSLLSLFDLNEQHDFLNMAFPLGGNNLPFWNESRASSSDPR